MSRFAWLGVVTVVACLLVPSGPVSGAVSERERRCLAMLAYAEAAGDGAAGMLAVMRVVHNRMAHPDFSGDACEVALAPGQFQPVTERSELRRALAAPEGRSLADVVRATTPRARLKLVTAWRLAAVAAVWPARDPTGGAIYFVNPRLMDPAKCPWFARLRRTAEIGGHVFMRPYRPGERARGPALDCGRGATPR